MTRLDNISSYKSNKMLIRPGTVITLENIAQDSFNKIIVKISASLKLCQAMAIEL